MYQKMLKNRILLSSVSTLLSPILVSQMNWRKTISKIIYINQFLRNFCFWGYKVAALSLMWHSFTFSSGKKTPTDYADVTKLRRFAPLHCFTYHALASLLKDQNFNFFPGKDTLKPCYMYKRPTP